MADYALFTQGQIWTLYCSLGWARGYATRAEGVLAMIAALKSDIAGSSARLLLQDETGYVGAPRAAAFLTP